MNDIENFIELIYPYCLQKMENDGVLKNYAKIKNATVSAVNDNGTVDVKFPYDNTPITVQNKTGETLVAGDVICLLYWIDLKNAVAIFKTKG